MKSAAILLLLATLFVATSTGTLVDQKQEEELISVLKKWKEVYEDGIKTKGEIAKRGGQAQAQSQQQSQTVTNTNQVNIHLGDLQQTVHHYHHYYPPPPSYGRYPKKKPNKNKKKWKPKPRKSPKKPKHSKSKSKKRSRSSSRK